MRERAHSREARIVALITAPGSAVYPSKINPGMVVVLDGRDGLEVCLGSADAAFDALFDMQDAEQRTKDYVTEQESHASYTSVQCADEMPESDFYGE